jgi:hypothetical protein
VARFWYPELLRISRDDPFLKAKFEAAGWSAHSLADSLEVTPQLLRKVKSDWFDTRVVLRPTVVRKDIDRWTAGQNKGVI